MKGVDRCFATENMPAGWSTDLRKDPPLDMVCPNSTANDAVGELI